MKDRPPPRPLTPDYGDVWSLPRDFAKIIRDIIHGTSLVRFDGEVDELWDSNLFYFEQKNWTEQQWYAGWVQNVIHHERPTTLFRRAAQRYHIQPQALRTIYSVVRHGNASAHDA